MLRMLAQRPRIGVGCLIRKGNKILLGKRIKSHDSYSWSPPGGHLEYGETPEEAVCREIQEEVGLTITHVERGPYVNTVYTDEGLQYITLFFFADYAGGEVQNLEPEKHADWDWFAWTDLPSPLAAFLQAFVDQDYTPFTDKK